MNRICVAIGMIALFLLAGCKSDENLLVRQSVSPEVKSNFEALMASYPEWKTFSSKGDVSIGMSASTQIKMIRGEALQVSVRFIVEVARVLVTPDSVFILNKVQRNVWAESMDKIEEKLSTPISLETIQDALLGRIFLLEGRGNQYDLADFEVKEGSDLQWSLSPRRQDTRFTYQFDLKGTQLLTTRLNATEGGASAVCQYSKFVSRRASENFPTQISLSLKTGSSAPISFSLNYDSSSIAWNSNVAIDNLNLSKYTRVPLSQVLKIL